MKSLKLFVACFALVLIAASRVEAYPTLQLDIIGGHYDPLTQTIVSDGPDFTLVALLTPKPNAMALLSDTFYISAAVNPQVGPSHSSLGSFSWNGTNYGVTEDMIYGTPPLEILGATSDPGDLAPHGVYPTFFQEFSFQFSPLNRVASYDTAVDTGRPLAPTTATSNISYFATFNVTTSLSGNNEIHFDLYNSLVQKCRNQPTCSYDEDIFFFAPFSHDAQSSNKVGEPQSMALMSVGLFVAGRVLRRKSKPQL